MAPVAYQARPVPPRFPQHSPIHFPMPTPLPDPSSSVALSSHASPPSSHSPPTSHIPNPPDADDVFRKLLALRIADHQSTTSDILDQNNSTSNPNHVQPPVTSAATSAAPPPTSSSSALPAPAPHPSPTLSRPSSPPALSHLNPFLNSPPLPHPYFPSATDPTDLSSTSFHPALQHHPSPDPTLLQSSASSPPSLSMINPSASLLYPPPHPQPLSVSSALHASLSSLYSLPSHDALPSRTSSASPPTDNASSSLAMAAHHNRVHHSNMLHPSRTVPPSSSSAAAIAQQQQHHHHMHHHHAQAPRIKNDLYKTEICRSFSETGGFCKYGSKCQFAHGQMELRPVRRHPRYKTKLCRNFSTTGSCPYDARCRFIHAPMEAMMAGNHPAAGSSPPAGVLAEMSEHVAVAAQQQQQHVHLIPHSVQLNAARHPVTRHLAGQGGSHGVSTPSTSSVGLGLHEREKSPVQGFNPTLQVYHPTANVFRAEHGHSSPAFSDSFLYMPTESSGTSGMLENHQPGMSLNGLNGASVPFDNQAFAELADPIAASVMAALREVDEEDVQQCAKDLRPERGAAALMAQFANREGDRDAMQGNGLVNRANVPQMGRSRLPVFRNMAARSEDA